MNLVVVDVSVRVIDRRGQWDLAAVVYVLNKKRGLVFTSEEALDPARFGSMRSTDYRFALPLSKLAPGPHPFMIEARTGAAGARRDLRFTVCAE